MEILQEAKQSKNKDERSLTIPEICTRINTTHEDGVLLIIAELGNHEIIAQTGNKTVYDPDGDPIYLGLFSLIR